MQTRRTIEQKDKKEKDISDLKYAIHGQFSTQGIAAGCELGIVTK